jgi:hypothetical protein
MTVIDDIIKADTSMNIRARNPSRIREKVFSALLVDITNVRLIVQHYAIVVF